MLKYVNIFCHLMHCLPVFSLQSIHRLKKGTKTDSDSHFTVDEVVDRIFQAVDSDGDGKHLVVLLLQ